MLGVNYIVFTRQVYSVSFWFAWKRKMKTNKCIFSPQNIKIHSLFCKPNFLRVMFSFLGDAAVCTYTFKSAIRRTLWIRCPEFKHWMWWYCKFTSQYFSVLLYYIGYIIILILNFFMIFLNIWKHEKVL